MKSIHLAVDARAKHATTNNSNDQEQIAPQAHHTDNANALFVAPAHRRLLHILRSRRRVSTSSQTQTCNSRLAQVAKRETNETQPQRRSNSSHEITACQLHTRTLSHSLTASVCHGIALTLSHTLPLCQSVSVSPFLSSSVALSLSPSLCLSVLVFLSLSLSLSVSLSLSLCLTLSLSFSLPLSVSICPCLSFCLSLSPSLSLSH